MYEGPEKEAFLVLTYQDLKKTFTSIYKHIYECAVPETRDT